MALSQRLGGEAAAGEGGSMAETGAETDSEQSALTVTHGAVEEGFSAKVQRAFALGWHVAELHYLPRDIRDPATPLDPLARAPDLDFAARARLLTAQISADLYWLDIKPSGEIRPLASIFHEGRSAWRQSPTQS
jgi:hypothetical protein